MTELRILLVEDEAIIAADIAMRLENLGYRIAGTCAEGEEALAFVEANPVDIAMMDINLRGAMDGIVAAEQLRARHRLPVIFLTAFADETTLARAKVVEPYGYIVKPCYDHDLKTTIELAWNAHQSARRQQATLEMLRICNEATDIATLATQVMTHLHALTGCACAAIRLRRGDDFPFVATIGFTPEMAAMESSLFLLGEDGQPQPAAAGGHELACLCGAVLHERTAPLPESFRTAAGSVWTGSIADMGKALSAAGDGLPGPRLECLRAGFESMAFIPLRWRGDMQGMIHLAEFSPGFFDTGDIDLLEVLAGHASVALAKLYADEALRQSETRFGEITAAAEEWIWEIDADARFTYSSPVVESLLGYRPDELVSQRLFPDLLSPDQRDSLVKYSTPFREHKMQFRNLAINFQHRDGRSVPVEMNVWPYSNGHGEMLGYRGLVRDLTLHTQYATALQQSEARYRRLLETATEGVWIVDRERRTTYVNQCLLEMTGYAAEELLGRTPMEFMDSSMREKGETLTSAHLRGEGTRNDLLFRRKDGSPLWAILATAPIRDDDGAFAGALGMLTDITERKLAESRLSRLAAIDRLFRSVTETLLFSDTPRAQLLDVLTRVGRHLDVSRAYICAFAPDLSSFAITNEWCAPGVSAQIESHRDIPVAGLEEWAELMRAMQPIIVTDAREHAGDIRAFLDSQEVQAMVALPLVAGGRLWGLVGFDEVRTPRSWQEEEMLALTGLATTIGRVLEGAESPR